jgi:acyl-CoA synthetase (AMP-forming)/AMP-acid ligase II
MPVPLLERAMAALRPVGFVNAYGLTETSSTVAVLTLDDHRQAFASADEAVRSRVGSVGRPLPGIELEIRDPPGRRVADGRVVRSWCAATRCRANTSGGRSSLAPDGWFATNDGGRVDASGFLYFEGRLDDVIVRGC